MGRPGSALDNAVIESWHSTVEWELRRLEHFATRARAPAGVAAWIEDYKSNALLTRAAVQGWQVGLGGYAELAEDVLQVGSTAAWAREML